MLLKATTGYQRKMLATASGIAAMTRGSRLAIPMGFILANADEDLLSKIFLGRFLISSARHAYVGHEWYTLYHNLPNKPYDFINSFNSTCPISNLKTLMGINLHEPNFIDKLISSNNFRPTSIINAFEKFSATRLIYSTGIFISLYNEWYGIYALLKDIKTYSENNKCPTVKDINKILAFAGSTTPTINIPYNFIDLWTQPMNAFIQKFRDPLKSYEQVASVKGISNIAFYFRDAFQLKFFQKFVKVALIPYWESQCFTTAYDCPMVINNGLAYENCQTTEESIDSEWYHQAITVHSFPIIKCEHTTLVNNDYGHNNCFEAIEEPGILENNQHQLKETNFSYNNPIELLS